MVGRGGERQRREKGRHVVRDIRAGYLDSDKSG